MGYVRHNAIVVTSWDDAVIAKAYNKAAELGCLVTGIVTDGVNSYRSFMIAPDGSEEGWEESSAGDIRRAQFRGWTQTVRHSDGSSPLEWVEIDYGSDDADPDVVDHEWHAR
jgi:hypothetical protein